MKGFTAFRLMYALSNVWGIIEFGFQSVFSFEVSNMRWY